MSKAPQTRPTANLTIEQMRFAIVKLKRRVEELRSFDPTSVTEDSAYAISQRLGNSIKDTLVNLFGDETNEYRSYAGASSISYPLIMGGTPLRQIVEGLNRSKFRSIEILEGAIATLEEKIADDEANQESVSEVAIQAPISNNKVFVVHGHDEAPRESVARFLQMIELEPIILHEQPNGGKTVIEKFESNSEVGFAVVILTPDDSASKVDGILQQRARQNVILELGYFIGKLGRSRVVALKKGELELPSDIHGVVWEQYDANGGWKNRLAKELQNAGYHIDWNKVMR